MPAPEDSVSTNGDSQAHHEVTLLPVRQLSEFAYCPRLFYLMFVDGRWADNEYTVEGRHVHRRTDKRDEPLPEEPDNADADDDALKKLRSVFLSSARLRLSSKLDLVELAGGEAVPVETKRGHVPSNEERSHEPERVQLMAQGMLLREHGYTCTKGFLFYAGSKTRVEVEFTPELETRTRELIDAAIRQAASDRIPEPLEDSPKCNGCSLVGICLPDETLALRYVPADPAAPEIRRLYPPRPSARPFYVQEQGATVCQRRRSLVVKKSGEEIGTARLKDVSHVALCGRVMITHGALHVLCEAGIPVVHLSAGHWFYGLTAGITLRNSFDRAAQYRTAADPARCLDVAKRIVTAKGSNQRTILRRNTSPAPAQSLERMKQILARVPSAASMDELLGLEGALAAAYFESFHLALRPKDFDSSWDFRTRNRRPPRDPVNALLSFAYALLSKECTVALLADGLDPWWGLYHKPRHGRPALALDLMEEFRPLIADSAVLTAVNTGMVVAKDFDIGKSGCVLRPTARKALIRAFESRMDQLITHPVFGYRISWRSVIAVQGRLLARWLRGDIPEYVPITTR